MRRTCPLRRLVCLVIIPLVHGGLGGALYCGWQGRIAHESDCSSLMHRMQRTARVCTLAIPLPHCPETFQHF